jgi:hypothetical protein
MTLTCRSGKQSLYRSWRPKLNIERLSLVLLKVAKDAKAQALLPAGPTGLQSEQQGQGQALQHWSPAGSAGLPAVARSAKEGSFLRVLCDLL